MLSTDQLRLNVDAYARYRVIDPVRMFSRRHARTTSRPAVADPGLRRAPGARTRAVRLAADGRARHDDAEHPQVARPQAREYGAQVIDVRIKRADLPDGTPLESAFDRMKTAREQEAAHDPRARAEAPRSSAPTPMRRPRRSTPTAYGKDPEFYDFYRAMQSYDTTFIGDGDGRAEPDHSFADNEYLRQFRAGSEGQN